MCFQVFSKGPDDKVYNANKDLREKVARGNSVLYINDLESKTIEQDCIIFALRKFTGGMYSGTFPRNINGNSSFCSPRTRRVRGLVKTTVPIYFLR